MALLTEQIEASAVIQAPAVRGGVALLTGGFDKPYTVGLATALSSHGVSVDLIGSDEVDSPDLRALPELTFRNLRNLRPNANVIEKALRVFSYYVRLIRYAASAEPKIFHVLWNNKFQTFDRTLLMLYYKLLGKRIVFTAHNINAGKRDGNDSWVNRLTLKIQYALSDHIFVHTEQMKLELQQAFGIAESCASVIPFGINTSVPNTSLTSGEARQKLGIGRDEKVILFFGSIRPYKGLEYLVDAFLQLAGAHPDYRLVIAGFPKRDAAQYAKDILERIRNSGFESRVTQRIEYIADEDTEIYFKAADALALPYTFVFQSGVLFLAYGFGLPVIATDIGSVKEDIVEGRSGFLCQPCDSADLAAGIQKYFESDLFHALARRRADIVEYARDHHSWDRVAVITAQVYADLLTGTPSCK